MNYFIILIVITGVFFSGFALLRVDVQHQKHMIEKRALMDEIEIIKQQSINVTCSWDIPAEHIGADLPPLPVRKGG